MRPEYRKPRCLSLRPWEQRLIVPRWPGRRSVPGGRVRRPGCNAYRPVGPAWRGGIGFRMRHGSRARSRRPCANRPKTRVRGKCEAKAPSRSPLAFSVRVWVTECWLQHQLHFDSLTMASAALPATIQLADPATTASSSNHKNPKSSMHSGKSGLMMMYPGMTAPGM